MSVRINATRSASQSFSLAFSPRAFAHILHNDFIIKVVAVEGFEPSIPKAIDFKSIMYIQFHHTAKSYSGTMVLRFK